MIAVHPSLAENAEIADIKAQTCFNLFQPSCILSVEFYLLDLAKYQNDIILIDGGLVWEKVVRKYKLVDNEKQEA